MNHCALCLKKANLVDSHAIPKFVINWLKSTSPTGYLRQAINPNLRKQDFAKEKLLCNDCEQLFSKNESYFAENIFYPYINNNETSFEYDERLKKFVVSVNWRLVTIGLKKDNFSFGIRRMIKKFLRDCRLYLLGTTQDTPFEHHVSFIGEIKGISSNINVPPRFHQYLLRAADSTIVTQKKKKLFKKRILFQYTKFPYFIFVSFIKPKTNKAWIGTHIKNSGVIQTKQEIKDGLYGSFLLERARIVNSLYQKNISNKQQELIAKQALKDPYKFVSSETFKAYSADKQIGSDYKDLD